jgi:hypothetical protein
MNRQALTVSAVACGLAAPWGLASAAGDFAPVGAKATLSVEYRFVAQGKKQDKYDLFEWNVKRSADVVAELMAQKPQPLSSTQAMEPGQLAKAQQQQAQAQKAAKQMAPMMADAQAVVAKCGGDEKCIEREVMKMGAGMAGTQQLADTQKVGAETASVMQPGADRYQRWQGRTQKSSYSVDETWHVVHADPICMSLPKARCTHDMTRKGAGDIAPSPSPATFEFDAQNGTLTVLLPVPMGATSCTETQVTNEPEGTHETPTPKGPKPCQMALRIAADSKSSSSPMKVEGSWRSQSGEYTVAMGAGSWHQAPGEPGKLVVRWRLVAQ